MIIQIRTANFDKNTKIAELGLKYVEGNCRYLVVDRRLFMLAVIKYSIQFEDMTR